MTTPVNTNFFGGAFFGGGFFGAGVATTHRPGVDLKRMILEADDRKIIQAIEEFLRDQPWRRQ